MPPPRACNATVGHAVARLCRAAAIVTIVGRELDLGDCKRHHILRRLLCVGDQRVLIVV
eukprot:CAMPEP_0119412566 /NCGR_PEP_ID=MMETSP1335-20130426/4966_1 /TAXON_ID=259385 /ORGANISM="Chrysoculter rhomboideus, Strain RCC1486" /LENGTH=58 /DNA_ID=CAMNT_0007437317 /DNA_START=61 /DNA_END=234 /DNA_ORIENTATION=+